MKTKFLLQIITSSELFYQNDVEMITVETLDGRESFLSNHEWEYTVLAQGVLFIKISDTYQKVMISGGILDVKKQIRVFTDEATWISTDSSKD